MIRALRGDSGEKLWTVADAALMLTVMSAADLEAGRAQAVVPASRSNAWRSTRVGTTRAWRALLVTGDSDTALQTCLDAVGNAASITLMHRREHFSAEPVRIEAFRAAQAAGQVHFVAGQPTGLVTDGERLSALRCLNADGAEVDLPCDHLVMALGLSPKLGPVADWGLQIERKQLVVNTETFATSAPGIFAVGDINTYPGKKKLILCGFHEATLAAFGAAAHLWPQDKTLLQYTTTSTTLHKRLGLI